MTDYEEQVVMDPEPLEEGGEEGYYEEGYEEGYEEAVEDLEDEIVGGTAEEVKLFGKWSFQDIEIRDISLVVSLINMH